MVGIVSYGAYIPFYRLSRAEISRAWGQPPAGGEKATANWDEDSITMAVAAALDCMDGLDREAVQALYLATTTSPYKEKQAAATVAAAADLRDDIMTMDCANSLRAGTIAIRTAIDAIKGGSAERVLTTASDCRLGTPQSAAELNFGDGAAALLFGNSGVAASVEGTHSVTDECIDIWRWTEDKFVHTWEDRFVVTEGYQRVMQKAVSEALKKYDLTAKDFAKVALYAPDARNHAATARSLGFDPKTQLVGSSLFEMVGNTGCALAPMLLIAALEESNPGDKILLASYGDGSDVYILQVTEEIEKIRERRGIKGNLASKMALSEYQKYLNFRHIVDPEPSRVPSVHTPPPLLWREQKSLIRLHGSKCKSCGEVQIPIQRICPKCFSKDEFEEVRLSDKKVSLFTFVIDALDATADPPSVRAIYDFDGGGRLNGPMTDRVLEEIKIGMPLEMTFRRFYPGGDVPAYFWKCKPIRG